MKVAGKEVWLRGRRFGFLLGFVGVALLTLGWESMGWSFLAASLAVIFLSRK